MRIRQDSFSGRYGYGNGFNRVAIIALLLGVLPNVPGFLTTIHVIAADGVPAWINDLYHYAWFVGFLVSGAVYLAMMKRPVIVAPSVTASKA